MLKKCLTLTALTTILGACSLQDPAPVISGFDLPWERKYREVKPVQPASQATAEATQQQNIEPAAGPNQPTDEALPAVPATYTPPAIRVSDIPQQAQNAAPTMQTYMVQDGDTVFSIARKHNTSVAEIMAANSLSNGYIQPGAVLMLPSTNQQNQAQQAVAELETKQPQRYSLTRSRSYDVSVQAAAQNTPAPQTQAKAQGIPQNIQTIQPAAGPVKTTPAPSKPPQYQLHTLEAGQTLYRLSQTYGVPVAAIRDANPGIEVDNMRIGQQVRIPTDKITNAATIEPAAGPVKSEQSQPQSYKMHTISAGETMYRLSQQYNVNLNQLMQANPAIEVNGLRVGQQVRIPTNGQASQSGASQTNVASNTATKTTSGTPKIIASAARASGLAWPVNGKIINKFGSGGSGIQHSGLNIAVPENTPVAAAAEGKVIYADSGLKSYGHLVLIRHNDGLVTAYAHNSSLTVKKDDTVKKGQVIAYSGKTGNVTQPQVHFEVRRNAQAVDPMKLLAKVTE